MGLDTDELELLDGTIVNYYFTCKREAWLYSHKIHADNWDENIIKGRSLSNTHTKKYNDIFSRLQFDKITKVNGHFEITEFKKSLKNPEAAKKQLLFYIYLLKQSIPKIKTIKGWIQSGKKRILVEVNDNVLNDLEQELREIVFFITSKKPPKPNYIKICDACAYRDYCY